MKESTLFGDIEVVKEVSEKSSFNVWNFIGDISKDKNYLLTEHTERLYEPWIVNKSFMSHPDTLLFAEQANRMHHLDKRMQHDFMFYSVEARGKRFKPWLKKTEAEKKELKLLQDISKVVGLNLQRTKQFWKVMSQEQRKEFLGKFVNPDSKNDKRL